MPRDTAQTLHNTQSASTHRKAPSQLLVNTEHVDGDPCWSGGISSIPPLDKQHQHQGMSRFLRSGSPIHLPRRPGWFVGTAGCRQPQASQELWAGIHFPRWDTRLVGKSDLTSTCSLGGLWRARGGRGRPDKRLSGEELAAPGPSSRVSERLYRSPPALRSLDGSLKRPRPPARAQGHRPRGHRPPATATEHEASSSPAAAGTRSAKPVEGPTPSELSWLLLQGPRVGFIKKAMYKNAKVAKSQKMPSLNLPIQP